MFNLSPNLLLLIAHLLLVGLLPGAFLCLLLQGSDAQIAYLAGAGAGLALLLLVWVGVLLGRRRWQRRWVGAGALALLVVADGLALCGGVVLLLTLGMASSPN